MYIFKGLYQKKQVYNSAEDASENMLIKCKICMWKDKIKTKIANNNIENRQTNKINESKVSFYEKFHKLTIYLD